MQNLLVDTIKGKRWEVVYEPEEVELFKLMMGAKDSRKRKIHYLELPCAFDIETTNIYKSTPEGNIDNSVRPFAFMYHWQICIRDQVCFGRDFDSLIKFFKRCIREMNLSYENRLVFFVHNLSYEWQFIRRFVEFTEGFFTEERKPLRVLIYGCIELRCSYMLSNMNLKKFCENERGVIHYKLSGEDFNYNKVRTQDTELTSKELAYCYNDVRGLSECIRSRMTEHTLANMPYTSTGYVRVEARTESKKNPKNREHFIDNQLDSHLYTLNRHAFRGGNVHANVKYTNQTIYDVQSFDEQSCYPAYIMTGLTPSTKFTKIRIENFLNLDLSEFAYLITFRLKRAKFKGKSGIPYIALSKLEYVHTDHVLDNGRVIYCEWCQMTCTDIDFNIIINQYDFEDILIKEVWISRYMPFSQEIKNVTMKYYRAKTELKGLPDREYEYSRSKGKLNAVYGMMVQRIDQTNTNYINGEYSTEESSIEEQLAKYYKSRNNFLQYQQGVWITAGCRKRLQDMLDIVGEDVVYTDTDSIKCVHDYRDEFEKRNAEIIKEAEKYGAYAEDIKGNVHYLGTWEYEGTYKEFKTLGAKKYVIKDDSGYHSTIAGVNKKVGEDYFNKYGIDAFKIGAKITDSGHLVAYYNDDEIHEITVDECTMITASNICLCNDSYTIGVTDDYLDLMIKAIDGIDNIIYN